MKRMVPWTEQRPNIGKLFAVVLTVDEDFQKTIALTDMSKEAENDWGRIPAVS